MLGSPVDRIANKILNLLEFGHYNYCKPQYFGCSLFGYCYDYYSVDFDCNYSYYVSRCLNPSYLADYRKDPSSYSDCFPDSHFDNVSHLMIVMNNSFFPFFLFKIQLISIKCSIKV